MPIRTALIQQRIGLVHRFRFLRSGRCPENSKDRYTTRNSTDSHGLLNPSRRSDLHNYRHSDAEALGLYNEIVVSDENMTEIGMQMRLTILQVCLCRV